MAVGVQGAHFDAVLIFGEIRPLTLALPMNRQG